MTNYDVSGTAGTVVGIAGMGIGLGILAHTARGVTETMYPESYSRRRRKTSLRDRRARWSRRGIKTIPVRPMYNWKL